MEIHEVLKSNIELSGYDHPTPVQRYGLPIALAGRDIMACAQTGSGYEHTDTLSDAMAEAQKIDCSPAHVPHSPFCSPCSLLCFPAS